MTAERWRKIRRICEDALERKGPDREAFLAGACAGDEQLRAEVDSFMSGAAGKEGFIETPAIEIAAKGIAEREVREAAPDLTGETFLHYRITEKIGAGGMGEVYRARDDRLKRDIAVKILPDVFTDDPDRLARFDREATLLASLNHPNVGSIYGIEQVGTKRFLVLELVEGETLAQRLTSGPMPLEAALHISRQIADGLQAAHGKGIIHRDLKPENVKVTPEGRVKILDFGLAKAIGGIEKQPDASPATALTGTATSAWHIVGTPGYMSPEQARGTDVDQRADVWAFGCLLFELLSGKRAFQGESVSDTISAILQSEPEWQTLPPGTPSRIRELMRQCLQKDANRRPNGAKAVAAIIEEVQRGRSRRRFASAIRRPGFVIPAAAILLLLGFLGVRQYQHNSRVRWVREQAIPQINRFLETGGDIAAGFRLLRRADALLPHDPALAQIHQKISVPTAFVTNPPGAEVWATGYDPDDGEWVRLGVTPFVSGELPFGIYRFHIEKPGFQTVLGSGEVRAGTQLQFDLDPNGSLPPEMVRVPGGIVVAGQTAAKLNAFLMDRYETTNRQFKEFVDRGGYQKREYWKEDFVRNGRTLSWEEAMRLFVDATGRPGPAAWKLGAYLRGQDNYPVSGVSWYEAAAYAEFVGKQLPTIFHWQQAASPGWFASIGYLSNYKGAGPAPVGAYKGIGAFGTLDMAGNVTEWCWNESNDRRFTRGGAWNLMDVMAFAALDARLPWDRSEQNGIRCARYDVEKELGPRGLVVAPDLHPPKEKPVPDEVFRLYQALYAYDPMDLDSRTEGIDEENSIWKRERVSFAATYGNERITGYLYLPKHATPPYQTIIYGHPGMAVRLLSPQPGEELLYDFIIRNGRAFFLPVLKGMYNRRYATPSAGLNMNRDRMIEQSKDFRRSIDYLMSRPDVDHDRLGVYGLSGFGSLIPILAVGEQGLKVAVLGSTGVASNRNWSLPEADTLNFLPRFRIPTLMINGRSDFGNPAEVSQIPMLRLLGAPEQDKKLLHWEGGHFPNDSHIVFTETLAWFDRYLGPVK